MAAPLGDLARNIRWDALNLAAVAGGRESSADRTALAKAEGFQSLFQGLAAAFLELFAAGLKNSRSDKVPI
jgi:hypothetical protein